MKMTIWAPKSCCRFTEDENENPIVSLEDWLVAKNFNSEYDPFFVKTNITYEKVKEQYDWYAQNGYRQTEYQTVHSQIISNHPYDRIAEEIDNDFLDPDQMDDDDLIGPLLPDDDFSDIEI
jgi:hypothetical protein